MRRLRPGDTLIWAGEPAHDIANVVSGAFKLVALSSEGQERTVGLVLPGDFVGDPLGRSNAFTVVALTEATVCLISQSAIARLLDQSPAFGITLLKRVVADLDQARRWVLMIGGRGAGARVAGLLSMLAAQARPPAGRVTIPFSRGDMAELLGLTLETASRRLHQLVRTGVITLPDRRGFIVLDPDRLAIEAA